MPGYTCSSLNQVDYNKYYTLYIILVALCTYMYIAVSLYIALDHDAAFSHAGSDEEFDDESVTGVVMEHYETLVSQLIGLYLNIIYYSYMYDV